MRIEGVPELLSENGILTIVIILRRRKFFIRGLQLILRQYPIKNIKKTSQNYVIYERIPQRNIIYC